MILYLTVAVVTVLLAGCIRKTEYVHNTDACVTKAPTRENFLNAFLLTTIFLILFILSACRQNVGNDYAKYVEFMHLVNCDAYVPTEVGFNALVKVLYGLSGFENYLLVFAVFAFFTQVFFLLGIYRLSNDFALSYLLFMAFGYYFLSFNTVRYYLALALALCAVNAVLNKKWFNFVLYILIGALFHKSLLVVLVLYPLASIRWKRWQLALAAVFASTFFFLQDFYLRVVVFLYPSYEDTEYLEGGTSIISILRCAGILVFALIYYRQLTQGSPMQLRRRTFFFYCNLGALVLYTCCSFLPIISRIGHYLMITHVLYVPEILSVIEDEKQKKVFRFLVIMAAILYFAMFLLRAHTDGIRVLPYQSFMFHDMVRILSDVN